MANMLGKHTFGRRGSYCKKIGCCATPRHTKSAQRAREERTWNKDWNEENAPEYPEWIDRVAGYVEARLKRN